MSSEERSRETPIRLIVVDDHGLFRASLARILAQEPGFEVAGECETSDELLEALKTLTVDVVLLGFDALTEQRSSLVSAARQSGYQGRFLLVAGSLDVRNAAVALKLGTSGIFLKSETPDRLVQAIRLVGSGGIWVDRTIIQLLADQSIDRHSAPEDRGFSGPLEDRERSVLQGILGGLTNREIGDGMGLAESSVKNIVQRLFGKAGVKTRSQLVRIALEGSGSAPASAKSQPNEMPAAYQRPHEWRRPLPGDAPGARQSHG